MNHNARNYAALARELQAMAATLKEANDAADRRDAERLNRLPMPELSGREWDETPSPRFPHLHDDERQLDNRTRYLDSREYSI
jgi:hypothetical protein